MGNANFRHRLTINPYPLKLKLKLKKRKHSIACTVTHVTFTPSSGNDTYIKFLRSVILREKS